MSITKTSPATLFEMKPPQRGEKLSSHREHVPFSDESVKTPSINRSHKAHQENKKTLEDPSLYSENNFSNIHKKHHSKDANTRFYPTKGDSTSTTKDRSVAERNELYDKGSDRVDEDEESNDSDFYHMPTPKALFSNATQAISNFFSNNTNASDSDSSESFVVSPFLPKVALSTFQQTSPFQSPQEADSDLENLLPTRSVSFSSEADSDGESNSTFKLEENHSLGAALSMGNQTGLIGTNTKEKSLSAAPTLPQDATHLPGAEANRSANFMHELQMNVAKLITDGQGKITFALKNVGGNLEGIATANLEIIPHPFHIAVQFTTDHTGIFNYLNGQKDALQTFLTGQFSGHVFDVKTPLMTQHSSQHFGTEGERAKDDIASFDQGNRERRDPRGET